MILRQTAGIEETVPVRSIEKLTNTIAKTVVKLQMSPTSILLAIQVFLTALQEAGVISKSRLSNELDNMSSYFKKPVN